MRFRKKASEADLVRYQPGGDPLPSDVRTRLTPDSSDIEVWNALHGSWIRLSPGDFINVTAPNDHYPIKRSVVETSYEPVA